MSVSTSTSSYTSESQWDPVSVTSNANPQNEPRFLVGQSYKLNPLNCNGANGIYYTTPKQPNVTNANCINSHNLYFNPPNYVNTGAPNGLISQDMRFQTTYNGFHNPVMVSGSRNGPIVTSVKTWGNPTTSGDRMSARPTWGASKPISGGVKKPKRIRTAFTSQQMMELENEYARTRYLDRSRRIELSEILHLNERTIKIWFQNRRMKEKKDRAESLEDTEATSTTELSPESGPVQMVMYAPYPHNSVGNLEHGGYVDQFQSVVASTVPIQNVEASMVAGCHDINNCYPTFVLENTTHLPPQFQQNNNSLPVHCQQLKDQYLINSKTVLQDFKEETLESSSNVSESSTNDTSKNDEKNWDLSWIRSIHIEEELQE